MLNSTEHEILNTHKYKNIKKINTPARKTGSNTPRMLFFPLINVKMPTIVGIITLMSRKNFMLSCVEHEKSFITSGPGPGLSKLTTSVNVSLNFQQLREADCKHRASDGNSKFCILLKISRFKALDKRFRLVKKSVKYVKRFSRYPSFYCCHGNHF